LAVVLDLVIGFSMKSQIAIDLVIDALLLAVWTLDGHERFPFIER